LTIKFTRHIPDESGLRRGKFYGPKFLLIARLDAFAFSVTPLRHVVLRATKSPCIWPKPNAEILRSFSPLIAATNGSEWQISRGWRKKTTASYVHQQVSLRHS